MFSIVLTTVITTLMLFILRIDFSWSFFIAGAIIILLSFVYMYDKHARKHFPHKPAFFHWSKKEHVFSHSMQMLFSLLLYLSAFMTLHTTTSVLAHGLILGGFAVSFFMYQLSVARGCQTLFQYEEHHLHLMAIVKLFTVGLFTSSFVEFTSLQDIPVEYSMVILGVIYSFLLFKFRQQTGLKSRSEEWWFILLPGVFAIILFYWLYQNLHANIFITACLFSLYYFCWGLFRHYLKKDCNTKVIIEHLLVAILIILVIGIQSSQGYWGRIL